MGSRRAVQSLSLEIALGAGAAKNFPLPGSGRALRLPGTVLIHLPDAPAAVTLTASVQPVAGAPVTETRTVQSAPHRQLDVAMVLGPLGPGADLGPPGCDGALCNFAWTRPIDVAAGAATPAGYSVRVPLDAALLARVRADRADLRVFAAAGAEQNRIVDDAPPGQGAALWFALAAPIAAGAADRYWLYYGDPNAAAAPADGTRVFAFYDEFGGAALDPHWIATGAPQVGGGVLTLRQNNFDGVRSDYQNDRVPRYSVVELSAAITSTAGAQANPPGGNGPFLYWMGYQRQNDFTTGAPWTLWIARGATATSIQAEDDDGTPGSNCASGCVQPTPLAQTTAAHVYRIERDIAETRYFFDGVQAYTAAAGAVEDDSLMLRNFMLGADLDIDWLRARALVSPEPTVTVGAEQPNR
jgi:hypothetical protein